LAEIEYLVQRYLEARQEVFDTRIREGRVVDGHGDLLAQDIFCLDDAPRVLDCLEFSDSLRYVDGMDDAAFLAMDLERLGAPDAAASFLTCYSEYAGDPAPPSLRHHYVAYRAFVRAKVSLIRAQQGAHAARSDAERLASITLRHLRTSAVRLVLVGGLPATGKSTVAAAIADRLDLTVLSSDRVRKELAGIPAEQSAPQAYGKGIYSADWTRRTYDELMARASALLSVGESVVIDATWTDREMRYAASEAARRCSADLIPLYCEASREVTEYRLSTRATGPSDAGPAVSEIMATTADPWPEAIILETGGTLESTIAPAMAAVSPGNVGSNRVFRRPYMETD
jgi:predicted kinase